MGCLLSSILLPGEGQIQRALFSCPLSNVSDLGVMSRVMLRGDRGTISYCNSYCASYQELNPCVQSNMSDSGVRSSDVEKGWRHKTKRSANQATGGRDASLFASFEVHSTLSRIQTCQKTTTTHFTYFAKLIAYRIPQTASPLNSIVLIRAVESDFKKSNKSRMPKSF